MNTLDLTKAAETARQQLGATGPRRLESLSVNQPPKATVPVTPEPTLQEMTEQALDRPSRNDIIAFLLNAPAYILDAQRAFDIADRAYQTRLASLTITAFSASLFPGKEPGTTRAASNDKEREAAIDKLITSDPDLIALAQTREQELRLLQYARNKFEGAKIAAQLLTAANL